MPAGWRELTNEELFELSNECSERLGKLQQQGVMFGGIGEHYIQTLLEVMLGDSQTDKAKELHFLWLKEQLDGAERQIAHAKIMQGVGGPVVGAPNGARRGPH